MKKNYLCLLIILVSLTEAFAQLQPANVIIKDDLQRKDIPQNSSKRSLSKPAKCGTDTIEYPYSKAISRQLLGVTVSKGRGLGQLYSCPTPITISGFDFYAFIIPSPPTSKKMNLICNLYKAGPDSLPRGLPLRSDTVTIDTTFGQGFLTQIIKRAQFAAITMDSNYILTVETDSSTLNAGVVVNSYQYGDGAKENLNCGSISGLWYNGKNLNIGGVPFDSDILLHPYVKYNFGTDFTIKNNCYNINDSIRLINISPKNVAGSGMYNRFKRYEYFCHQWNVGDFSGTYNDVDYVFKYNDKADYNITLISNVYTFKSSSYVCTDTSIRIIRFKPDVPSYSGPSNACIGDTATFTALSADTGVVYEWFAKTNSQTPFLTGKVFKKFPLTKNDTFYLRANNDGCTSGFRTIILKVNSYPTALSLKDDSVCSGSRANLKASSNTGTVQWFSLPVGGVPFFTGNIYQTNVLLKDTFFYAQAGNNGCLLSPRSIVRAFVGSNFAPFPPVVSNDTVVCLSSGNAVSLNAAAPVGLTIRWFDVSSGGSPINTGSTYLFLPVKREVRTFYADAYNGICGSTRIAVNVNVEDHPAITAIKNDAVCLGDSSFVSFQLPYGQAEWFKTSTGGASINSGTSLSSLQSKTEDYYIETSSFGCISSNRTKISSVVNTFPPISKLWGDTICAKNTAKLRAVITGQGTIQWYDSDTSTNFLAQGNTFITPVLNGSRKYYASSSFAGCNGPRLAVQPLVKPAPFTGIEFSVLTFQQVKVNPINSGGGSVKWYFGDGNTSTKQIVTHRYQNTGTYQIKLVITSLNGCKDSSTVTVLIETSSIKETSSLPQFEIFPNPAGNQLNASSDNFDNGFINFSIFSVTGVKIYEGTANANEGNINIDLSGISAGIYVLEIGNFKPLMFIRN